MSIVDVAGPSGSLRASRKPVESPPWLSFSGRWPWVRTPLTATFVRNGSLPPAGLLVMATGMIAIDSYQEARVVSYVPETDRTSPFLTATRQLGGLTPIETSQDTAPAGSKKCARERNSSTVLPWRVSLRSVHSPP